MIDYINLSYATDPKIVGSMPQVYLLDPIVDSETVQIVSLVEKNCHNSISFTEEFIIRVEKAIKLTDILSSTFLSSYCGILVSPKLLLLLEEFKVPPFNATKVRISHAGNDFLFYWLHFTSNSDESIDYYNSSFVEIDPRKGSRQIIFNSYEDYKNHKPKLKSLERIIAKNLKLREDFDFIKLSVIFRGFLVSERLYSAMLQNNISGFEKI
jgi:hypothetical protein